jgi:hypothetical protein
MVERLGVAQQKGSIKPTYEHYQVQSNPQGDSLTTLISWVSVDQRGPAALYLASDSRITWGSQSRRWDAGRKLFACGRHPDVFGYVGEVIFPSLVLGQVIEAADRGLIFADELGDPDDRHSKFVNIIKKSFCRRHNSPNYDFQILHGSRSSPGLNCRFHIWLLSYSAHKELWRDEKINVSTVHSSLVLALGSGAQSAHFYDRHWKETGQGRTSRAVFWAFCETLRSGRDPLSGGPPQLVSLYRQAVPHTFGVVYEKKRYFHGLPLNEGIAYGAIEWRDELFQRVDGETMTLLAGAQRHARS